MWPNLRTQDFSNDLAKLLWKSIPTLLKKNPMLFDLTWDEDVSPQESDYYYRITLTFEKLILSIEYGFSGPAADPIHHFNVSFKSGTRSEEASYDYIASDSRSKNSGAKKIYMLYEFLLKEYEKRKNKSLRGSLRSLSLRLAQISKSLDFPKKSVKK